MSAPARVCLLCRNIKKLSVATCPAVWSLQTVRDATNKHYRPEFRKARGRKVFRFELPDYQKIKRESSLDADEMRATMKKKGYLPPRTHQERNIIIASTSTVFEAYVPPEGDGVASIISAEGTKQRLTEVEKKGKSYLQIRKIRQFDEDFSTKTFPEIAQEIYIEAHELLNDIEENEDRLHELVTEKAYPEMVWKLDKKTVRWDFYESVEAPRVVHVRTTDLLTKDNLYAQVTVRFHTKQSLAVYDRFGRLMFGGEKLVKDALEYVVFERHLANEHSDWRIHGKIIPDWMPPQHTVHRTLRQPHFEPIPDKPEGSGTKEAVVKQDDSDGPALATA